MSTIIDTIPNRPAGKPVFDFTTAHGFARVPLATVSNDSHNLVVAGWAYAIDAQGLPVLDPATAAPIATQDGQRSVQLSGVLAGTHALYDAWVRYVPDAGTTIDAGHLPDGWSSGSGDPTGMPAYGAGYFDTTAGKAWIYAQGCLTQAAQSFADALEMQIDTAAKLADLGL
jgi:hypothetical protein